MHPLSCWYMKCLIFSLVFLILLVYQEADAQDINKNSHACVCIYLRKLRSGSKLTNLLVAKQHDRSLINKSKGAFMYIYYSIIKYALNSAIETSIFHCLN